MSDHILMSNEDSNSDLTYKITAKSKTAKETVSHSHLITELIQGLIENAGTSWWMKDEEDVQPDEFYAAVLNSLLRLNYFTDSGGLLVEITPYEYLTDMLSNLNDQGLIDKEMPKYVEYDDELDDED